MALLSLITSGLNPDIDKYKFVNKKDRNVHFEERENVQKKHFILNKDIDDIDDVVKIKIQSLAELKENWDGVGAKKLTPIVINNAINIIDNISPFYLTKLDEHNIYSTNYGTIIFDWEFESEKVGESIFSLEIGKKSIGYFSEKNGETSQQVDSLNIDKQNILQTIAKINQDLFSLE